VGCLIPVDFKVSKTEFAGLYIIEGKLRIDERGLFERLYCEEALISVLNSRKIAQVNHSFTKKKGTVRGLHYQTAPFEELKIVSCIVGNIFDVVLDLRPGSQTYGKSFSITLSEDAAIHLVVPEGFAHGFQTLTKNVHMIYFHTAPFVQEAQAGFSVMSDEVRSLWPIPISIISSRDESLPLFSKFGGFDL
jgi:dTDP-4-dehydrorhamnose 3,5-epimerase